MSGWVGGWVGGCEKKLYLHTGLDATASYEILTHLNKLADSNRTVVLTIHQPRLEIFHMFHQLVLLSDGKVCNLRLGF